MAGDTYYIGDRLQPGSNGLDYADAAALSVAAESAYAMAGITRPAHEVDVVETYASFSPVEIHNAEALPLNPSGGVICTNPISVTAMVRVAEAALQIQGRAGAHQVPDARVAVATGAGGSHQFFNVAVVTADRS
jgi:acetyl-CoA C-acetyltransferase